MPADEFCLFWLQWWPLCMTKAEWSGWVQAVGSILAIGGAAAFPLHHLRRQTENARQERARERKEVRQGHLETIALDVLIAEQQAATYLRGKVRVPAYRAPLHGLRFALPKLLADGTLKGADAMALALYYVDAKSFNDCLDLAQELKARSGPWEHETKRIRTKASHLVPSVTASRRTRYDVALRVLRDHLPSDALQRLSVGPAIAADDDDEDPGPPPIAGVAL